MSQPFVGQVIPVGFNFAPQGWHLCDGSLLSISEFSTLFNLIGTTFGGNGTTTFALPDLRGRAVVDDGQGSGLQPYIMGEQGGAETTTITSSQIPSHTHALSGAASVSVPTPGPTVTFGTTETTQPIYATAGASVTLLPQTVAPSTGSGQPHENRQPLTTVNYIIALFGIYPSQN
jgi:microcystin-dependent protein